MAKDPAFLFYSKDWLEGTAEMSKEAKGVYIDLLAHHHQKDGLPNDTRKLARLAGMSEMEFTLLWECEIRPKFYQNGDRLYNRRLTEVMTERLTKGHRNKIIGTLAAVIRLSPADPEIKKMAKKGFCVDDFLTETDQTLTVRLTEWFLKRLKSIEDENANEDENINKGGPGEKPSQPPEPPPPPGPPPLAAQMVQVFKEQFTHYPIDQQNDFPACVAIAQRIAKMKGWPLESITNGHMDDILSEWETIVLFARGDPWYSKRALSDLNKEFQRLIQAKNGNKTDSADQSANGKTKGEQRMDALRFWGSKEFFEGSG